MSSKCSKYFVLLYTYIDESFHQYERGYSNYRSLACTFGGFCVIVSSQKGNSSVGTTKLSVVSNVNAERLTCWLKRHHYEPTPFC